jgi:hypothetical protein
LHRRWDGERRERLERQKKNGEASVSSADKCSTQNDNADAMAALATADLPEPTSIGATAKPRVMEGPAVDPQAVCSTCQQDDNPAELLV